MSELVIGILLSLTGKKAEALRAFEAARAIHEALARDNPAVTGFQSSLAHSHNNIGYLLSETGKPAEALRACEAARAIVEGLARDNPAVTEYRRDLAASHNDIGDMLRKQGRPADARAAYERALALKEPLARDHPQNTRYQTGPAYNLRGRGLARLDQGDPAGAAADARRTLAIWDGMPSRTAQHWYETACCRAALAGLAGRDGSGVSAAEGVSEADAAVGLLRKAAGMGYRNLDAYRTEDALDPLRGREDFRLLMMDLALPADPFAAGR